MGSACPSKEYCFRCLGNIHDVSWFLDETMVICVYPPDGTLEHADCDLGSVWGISTPPSSVTFTTNASTLEGVSSVQCGNQSKWEVNVSVISKYLHVVTQ
jgi:hypothetical protein